MERKEKRGFLSFRFLFRDADFHTQRTAKDRGLFPRCLKSNIINTFSIFDLQSLFRLYYSSLWKLGMKTTSWSKRECISSPTESYIMNGPVAASFESPDFSLMQTLYLLPVLGGHPVAGPVLVFLHYFYLYQAAIFDRKLNHMSFYAVFYWVSMRSISTIKK